MQSTRKVEEGISRRRFHQDGPPSGIGCCSGMTQEVLRFLEHSQENSSPLSSRVTTSIILLLLTMVTMLVIKRLKKVWHSFCISRETAVILQEGVHAGKLIAVRIIIHDGKKLDDKTAIRVAFNINTAKGKLLKKKG